MTNPTPLSGAAGGEIVADATALSIQPTGSTAYYSLADIVALVLTLTGGSSSSLTALQLATVIQGLPTGVPATAGTLWLNGGVLCITPGSNGASAAALTTSVLTTLIAALPTSMPSAAGALWLDGNLVSITPGSNGSTATSSYSVANLAAAIALLPTTTPASAGNLWLDSGVVSVS